VTLGLWEALNWTPAHHRLKLAKIDTTGLLIKDGVIVRRRKRVKAPKRRLMLRRNFRGKNLILLLIYGIITNQSS
jgi:hypothetical protein